MIVCGNQNRILAVIFAIIVLVVGLPLNTVAATDYERPVNINLIVNDSTNVTVSGLYYNYDRCLYISLRDLANALVGTEKHFELSVKEGQVSIITDMDYRPIGSENTGFDAETLSFGYENRVYLRHNTIYVDDREKFYYTFIMKTDSRLDCFMNITDIAMELDLDMDYQEDIRINTGNAFEVDIDALEAEGYFRQLNACLVGNADTGEIFFEAAGDKQCAMASTTKLMTYLIIKDAEKNGIVSMEDMVTISEKAAIISHTGDGVIWFEKGSEFKMADLMDAMLLASSNESALAMAEQVAGSEQAFVDMMNAKASEIGLSDKTIFYNSNGLPSFANGVAQTKRQNYTTAEDMFKLASYILNAYPELTDITSKKKSKLESIGTEVSTTNAMLYNIDSAVGLKTGTTNRAGCCLVSCAINDNGEHIIAVEFGAESGTLRGQASQLLLLYGLSYNGVSDLSDEIPTDCEGLLRLIVRKA